MNAGSPDHPPKNLLVVRLGAMGDVIHTMYAVALLRSAFPETRIGWAIEERWAELLCAKGTPRSGARSSARPLVDFVHVMNTKSWRKSPLSGETRRQFSSALGEIREQRYEIAIDFQGAIKSALLARISGAKIIFGMDKPRETPARVFYSQRVQVIGTHVIEHYSSLAKGALRLDLRDALERTAGAPSNVATGIPTVEFPQDRAANAEVSRKLQSASSPIVLITPGAGWGAKQWPAERYGAVARILAEEGCSVVVNYGPGEEQLARIVKDSSRGAAHPVTCSLAELIVLTRRASLFIGGDTGPLHLAAAQGIPVVAIFGPTDPARNGPYTARRTVLRNSASRTSLSHTASPDPGLLKITSDEVLTAARTLLESTHA